MTGALVNTVSLVFCIGHECCLFCTCCINRAGFFNHGSSLFSQILTAETISELTATGGVIMLGIAIHVLELKKIRLAKFLPTLAVAPLIVWISGIIQG